jgi:tetratricopeptide (TPR) repeat protein
VAAPEAAPEAELTEAPPPLPEQTRRERKRLAKEARIAEYLAKQEQRRAARESSAAASEPTAVAPAGETVASTTSAQTPAKGSKGKAARLPRNLARAQANVRATRLGQDPTVQVYLDLIDRQGASAGQLAAFGNFLAENGLGHDALQYYDIALNLEPKDPLLWTNVGTLYRQVGDSSAALSAYNRALSLDPNNALAHYNVGAVLDAQGKYEESIEEYKLALHLDPMLGDPAYNPQAANNQRLLAVKLLLYHEQVGSLGLPLADVPGGQVQGTEGQQPQD